MITDNSDVSSKRVTFFDSIINNHIFCKLDEPNNWIKPEEQAIIYSESNYAKWRQEKHPLWIDTCT